MNEWRRRRGDEQSVKAKTRSEPALWQGLAWDHIKAVAVSED